MAKRDKNHHLLQRRGTWYFRAMIGGKRYRKALSSSVTEARKLRDEYLKEILLNGSLDLPQPEDQVHPTEEGAVLFGEVALEWRTRQKVWIKKDQLKSSTWRDWKSTMNSKVLPFFGNIPICSIDLKKIDKFVDQLECGPKRVNNILVPVRSVFDFAKRQGYISENPMNDVQNLSVTEPDIFPLNIDEVNLFFTGVNKHYLPFFKVAFFTGMRFGEMAALKWHQIDFQRKLIKVRETLVYGEEGRPKTAKSQREIDMLPPVCDALQRHKKIVDNDLYAFRDIRGKLMTPDHIREVIWKPALKKVGLTYRPPSQTRHTFATLMIDAGEDLGWVQRMMGHGSLQMIYTRYYSWTKKETRSDGSAFMKNTYLPETFEANSELGREAMG